MSAQHQGKAPPLIRLEQVTKRYPGVLANDAITLDLHAGEIHALLGENGAGKSTLIALLAGMQQPDAGRLLIDGRAVRFSAPRAALQAGIGTVYQHSALVPSLTVLENLMLGRRWWQGRKQITTRRRFSALCDELGVRLPADALLSSLSLGERQTVEIVKALWEGRRLLILDEASAMLTPSAVGELQRSLTHLAAKGMAILFVTHKLPEALAFGDRVSILRAGRLVASRSAADLHRRGPEQAQSEIISLMFDAPATSPAAPAPPPSSKEKTPLLRVQGLRAECSEQEPQLGSMDFSLSAGEILGVAGIDGNGQRQLAEALAGQRAVIAGRIELDGNAIQAASVPQRMRQGLRYLTDDRLGEGSLPAFPISLNLLLKRLGDAPFWRHGVEQPREIEANAQRTITTHNIRAPGPNTPLGSLSGGNVQKLLLARELEGQPRVVIYNKPTYGLDFQTQQLAHAAIRRQAASGVAALLISPDLDELLAISHRVAVMAGGRIVGVVHNGPDARQAVGRLMVAG